MSETGCHVGIKKNRDDECCVVVQDTRSPQLSINVLLAINQEWNASKRLTWIANLLIANNASPVFHKHVVHEPQKRQALLPYFEWAASLASSSADSARSNTATPPIQPVKPTPREL